MSCAARADPSSRPSSAGQRPERSLEAAGAICPNRQEGDDQLIEPGIEKAAQAVSKACLVPVNHQVPRQRVTDGALPRLRIASRGEHLLVEREARVAGQSLTRLPEHRRLIL